MGGRITGISVYDADPCTYWIASASGGLLKTVNNGVTFEHQFDHENTVSIGSVCVAPSDPKIVWVGTGENNPRNSVSYGDGVYKSTDGGQTWKNMGLKETFQIGKVVVHPKNPDIVYVGALGRLWGHNKERGLYKTTDGGSTWQKVLYIDDRTGIIDIVINPADPETLLVAAWERQRDGFDSHRGDPPVQDGYDAYDPIRKWGTGGGIYKTTDGGKTFRKLTRGLPSSPTGRIGLDIYRKNPGTVFAIVDCQKIGMGPPESQVYLGIQGEDAPGGAKLTAITENSPAARAGLKPGDLVTLFDKKAITGFEQLGSLIPEHKAGDKIAAAVTRDGKSVQLTVTLENRPARTDPIPLPRLLGALTMNGEGGVRIERLFPDGSAETAGLKEGDLIQEAEKKKVENIEQLQAAVAKHKIGDKVSLAVLREGKTQRIEMKIEDAFGGGTSRNRPYTAMYSGQSANVQDKQGKDSHEYGGLYRSEDGGETWKRINSINPRPMYFSQVRVDPTDEKYLYVLGVSLSRSSDGGKTFAADGGNGVHPDQHALWIDPRDGRHMVVGCDGGFYVTYDRMARWDHLNTMAIGQFYHVAIDAQSQPYRVIGGLQDNGSWSGPSRSLSGSGPINEDWIVVGGGDGFVCRVDQNSPEWVYYESQDGNIGRRNLRTGESGFIRPKRERGKKYRFNWNTPFLLSHHNSRILYCAGNYVFRSLKQGDDMRVISPEISHTGRGTATALAESPRNPDVLWVGTDDGNLWVTQDGGAKWTNVVDHVGLRGRRWVSTVEPSHYADGRAYVAFDGHRSDDDEPYVYMTEDFGKTWKSVRSNLPTGSTHCLREDIKNQDLLFAGTEFAAWVSLNRGASWTRLNNNLPTVAIFEFAFHPTNGEMVVATHGRSLWALNIAPLRQMSAGALTAVSTLYEPAPVVRWRPEPSRGSIYGTGHRHWVGENPPRGAQIFYSLTEKASSIKLTVSDYTGTVLRELDAEGDPGVHLISWDLGRTARRPGRGFGGGAPDAAAAGSTGAGRRGGRGGRTAEGAQSAPARGSGQAGAARPAGGGQATPTPPGGGEGGSGQALEGGGQGGGSGGFRGFGQTVGPGAYKITLTVNGKEYVQTLRVENDPTLPAGTTVSDSESPQELESEEEAERLAEMHPLRPIDN